MNESNNNFENYFLENIILILALSIGINLRLMRIEILDTR